MYTHACLAATLYMCPRTHTAPIYLASSYYCYISSVLILLRYAGAELLFCESSAVSAGTWVPDALNGGWGGAPRIQLALCASARLRAETTYVFAITVTNPSEPQPPPDLTINATGWLTFETEGATSPSTSARGLPLGSRPLTVVVPQFILFQCGQTNPAAGLANVISLTLMPNVDVYGSADANSAVITFTFTVQADLPSRVQLLPGNASDANDGRNNVLGLLSSSLPPPVANVDTGLWDATRGVLTFFVLKNKRLAGQTLYVLSFEMMNPDNAVEANDISVEASGDVLFPRAKMHQASVSVGGWANGGHAFFVVRARFETRSIWQANPVVGQANTIAITLSSNFDLYGKDSPFIFIAGLVGAGLEARVKLLATPPNLICFSGEGNYAAFDTASSTLSMQLCPTANFLRGDVLRVSFNLTNPTARQASPDIRIHTNGTTPFLPEKMVLSEGGWKGLPVAGHSALLTVALPCLSSALLSLMVSCH